MKTKVKKSLKELEVEVEEKNELIKSLLLQLENYSYCCGDYYLNKILEKNKNLNDIVNYLDFYNKEFELMYQDSLLSELEMEELGNFKKLFYIQGNIISPLNISSIKIFDRYDFHKTKNLYCVNIIQKDKSTGGSENIIEVSFFSEEERDKELNLLKKKLSTLKIIIQ